MTSLRQFLFLIVASSLAFLGTARAQLVTYETISTWDGSVSTFQKSISTASTRAEIFTKVLAISSITYTLFPSSNQAAQGTLTAKFGEWNSTSKALVPGTITDFGSFTIPAYNLWTGSVRIYDPVDPIDLSLYSDYSYYNLVFSFPTLHLTDPTKSYAMVLKNTTSSTSSYALGVNALDPFSFGQSFNGANTYDEDYTFSQIVVVPLGNIVPVPEASTTAAFAACGLVGALVALRRRQKQKLVAA
jgi:hypothetical protein